MKEIFTHTATLTYFYKSQDSDARHGWVESSLFLPTILIIVLRCKILRFFKPNVDFVTGMGQNNGK